MADIPRSKGQRSRTSRRLTPWPKISYVFGTGRPAGHHLQGAGVYCGSRTTDRIAVRLFTVKIRKELLKKQELKLSQFPGTFVPGSECSQWELSLRGAKIPGSEKSLNHKPLSRLLVIVPLIEYGLGYRSQIKFNQITSTITTITLNPNSNPKTDPNPKSKNNVCSTKRHWKFNIVLYI